MGKGTDEVSQFGKKGQDFISANSPKEMSVDEGIEVLALDMRQFAIAFNREASALSRLENSLNRIEKILSDDQTLIRMSRSELMELYRLTLDRKEIAHKFMLKIADLGLKTDFLNKLSNNSLQKTGRISTRPNIAVRQAVAVLNDLASNKLGEESEEQDYRQID